MTDDGPDSDEGTLYKLARNAGLRSLPMAGRRGAGWRYGG